MVRHRHWWTDFEWATPDVIALRLLALAIAGAWTWWMVSTIVSWCSGLFR
jgi:hypothetical protein